MTNLIWVSEHPFIRSATNMKWIEEKMKLLGCSSNPNYKLAFYLDSRAMISIQTEKYGIVDVSVASDLKHLVCVCCCYLLFNCYLSSIRLVHLG